MTHPRRTRGISAVALLALAAGCAPDTTAPGTPGTRPSFDIAPLLSSTTVVVSPASPNGWAFFDDNGNGGSGALVAGPGAPPAGVGSAELQVLAANQGYALGAALFAGTRFADMTTLEYSTYRQSADAGNNLAIALQFNLDHDVTDANNLFQGRLVFEPYQTFPGGVTQGAWQTWNALAGRWWRTSSAARRAEYANPGDCLQANPCTWAQILANWPNAGVHPTLGAVVLKAGSGWASFTGNTDKLTIGVSGDDITYDFEPYIVAGTKDQCKNGGWRNVQRADGSGFKNQGDCIQYVNTGK